MNELIPIHDNNGKKAVNARDLHAFLGSKKDFSSWIKNRIEKYGLIEDQDYTVFTQMGENLSGGRPTIEYALTLDAAKELSMVEGNSKGKQARKYFIACEARLKEEVKPLTEAEKFLQVAKISVEQERKIFAIEKKQLAIEAQVNELKEIQEKNQNELLKLPLADTPVEPISLRKQVSILVGKYAIAMNIPYEAVWNTLYIELENRYHIRLKSYKKENDSEKRIDIADRIGAMGKLHIIISNMVKNIAKRA